MDDSITEQYGSSHAKPHLQAWKSAMKVLGHRFSPWRVADNDTGFDDELGCKISFMGHEQGLQFRRKLNANWQGLKSELSASVEL